MEGSVELNREGMGETEQGRRGMGVGRLQEGEDPEVMVRNRYYPFLQQPPQPISLLSLASVKLLV